MTERSGGMQWPDELFALRRDLRAGGIDVDDVDPDPLVQFERWVALVRDVVPEDPDAVVLTTVGPDGSPEARNVLLRGLDDGAFVFFTSYESRKARAIAHEPRVTLLFSWVIVGRQYTVRGVASKLDDAASDAYWATRPRGSQIAAWASPQSEVMPDRAALEARWAEVEAAYVDRDVPRPPSWGGYRVVPDEVELWQGRDNRLHDRLRYRVDPSSASGWRIERLAP
jgi:pyridoxamine 5'-phosphate oxidase